jgi:hypothetical protein
VQITKIRGLIKNVEAHSFVEKTGDTKDDPAERLMHSKDCDGCSGLQIPQQL